jgi:hypothetical protein
MAAPTKLTQAQIDELKEKVRHFRHESGSVAVPADVLNLLLLAYVVS